MEEELPDGWSAFIHHRIIARALLPAMRNVSKRFAVAQVTTDETTLACALERYRQAHGQLPEKLATLAPQFLAKVPHDVLTGEPLKYERLDDAEFVGEVEQINEVGTGGGGRTHTPVREPDFESSASANSATPAQRRNIDCDTAM